MNKYKVHLKNGDCIVVNVDLTTQPIWEVVPGVGVILKIGYSNENSFLGDEVIGISKEVQ